MSYIPIILIAYFLLSNNNQNINNFISTIDLTSIKPVLEFLNVDQNILSFLESENFTDILNGNVDIKKLLPLIISIFNSFKKPNNNSTPFTQNEKTYNNNLNPIKDIGGEDVYNYIHNSFT